MKGLILALLFTTGAYAFQSQIKPASRKGIKMQESKADLEKLAKELNPIIGFYDPLNLAEAEFWDQSNEATIGFLRHAEIKHGRVAMAAFVGYCVHAAGIQFPKHIPGEYTTTSPAELWDQVPTNGQLQIIFFIGFLEYWSELGERVGLPAHYMRGGKPGAFNSFKDNQKDLQLPHPVPFDLYDPFGFNKKKTEEKLAEGRLKEINNGRLAMIGIFGFLAESKVPGSVPFLTGKIAAYDGDYMAPLSPQVTDVVGTLFGSS